MKTVPHFQPFRLFLLAAVARVSGDPDWKILTAAKDSFASGVPVGTEKMPRTPAVYERKLKWRSLDDTEFVPEKSNYQTAVGNEEQLEAQFQEEAKMGMCFKVTCGVVAGVASPSGPARSASSGGGTVEADAGAQAL